MSEPDIAALIEIVSAGENLNREQAAEAARLLAHEATSYEARKAFLLALTEKGGNVDEVIGFTTAFRELAVDPGLEDYAENGIDIVGTGGDKSGSFNISTTTGLILASMGVPVLKHGNRSVTSKSGSADLLELLGIPLQSDAALLRESLETLSFCYFFAPAFHPAFKHIMPVRKELAAEGKRTIFNVLGPLINPAKPMHQMLGVYAERWVFYYAATCHELGLKSGLVVHSQFTEESGMDELTCAVPNRVMGFGTLIDVDTVWKPSDFGFKKCNVEDLAGGDAKANFEILQQVAQRDVNSGLMETILFNAAAALMVAGRVNSVPDGVDEVEAALMEGRLADWLARAQDFYAGK